MKRFQCTSCERVFSLARRVPRDKDGRQRWVCRPCRRKQLARAEPKRSAKRRRAARLVRRYATRHELRLPPRSLAPLRGEAFPDAVASALLARGFTNGELGAAFDVSRERIRQIAERQDLVKLGSDVRCALRRMRREAARRE